MARRRSLNRRWSRRSLNATELDQDSEVIDTDNPLWWKNLEGDTTMRPSMPASVGETTGSILDTDSRVDPSELRDAWWDNLERTQLGSSRRFSARQSIHPDEAIQESFVSEGDDDVSIKKRKVLLRPRTNQSRGHDNFLKALDESDGAARSEPVSGKRKSKSPARSDTELLRKKTRNRRSHTAEISKENVDDASITSNETDVVAKQRPRLFKKRLIVKQLDDGPDDGTQNDAAGSSGINISKNSSRHDDSRSSKISANETPKAIDSNESGLMGPPKTASHRKRLSTISRKLNLTSEDSEDDAAPKRAKVGFAKKARERASINPFDEILSGHLEEDNSHSELRANNSAAATKTPKKNPQSQDDDSQIGVAPIANDDNDDDDETSTMETVPMGDSVSKTQRYSTREPVTTGIEYTEIRRSISVTKEIPRFSKGRPHSIGQSTLLTRENITAEESKNRMLQDWQSSDSENDGLLENPSKSMSNVSKENSTLQKINAISISRVSAATTLHSQRIDELDEKSDDEDRAVKRNNRSMRSTSHSRIIAESAYELPDKERSDSPIISLSENEIEKSVDKLPREKKSTRESANRSIDRVDANISRQSSARMNASPQKIDSDESISEEEAKSLEITEQRSTNQDSRLTDVASTSRKSANAFQQRTLVDDIVSEEDAEEEAKNNTKSSSFAVKKKSNTARKSTSYRNKSLELNLSEESSKEIPKESENTTPKLTKRSIFAKKNSSQQRIDSDDSISEEKPHKSEKSMKRNSSRQRIESDESVSEEEPHAADRSRITSTRRSLRAEGRNSDAARNSSMRADVSGQNIESDDTRGAAKSKSTDLSTKRKVSVARNSSANVSTQFRESANATEEDVIGEEKTNAKSVRLPPKKKISTARKNVSTQRIESDESSDEENPTKGNSKSRNLSTKGKMTTSRKSTLRGNVSKRLEDERTDDADESNAKLANQSPKRKISRARKSIAHGNVSAQRIESDESSDEENPTKGNSKSRNLSTKGKMTTSRKSTLRGNVSKRLEDERTDDADESNAKLANQSPKRKISRARKSIAHGNVSAQRIESDESSDEENPTKGNSKSRNLSTKGKMSTSRKSTLRGNVSKRLEDERTDDVDESNAKLAKQSPKRKISRARKSIPHGNVSAQRIESDENSDEENPTKGNSKSRNLSTKEKMSTSRKSTLRSNVSGRLEDDGADETNATTPNQPHKRKISTSRKSNEHGNVSAQRIESDESEEEVETAEKSNTVTAKVVKKNLSTRPSKNRSVAENTTNRNKSTLSTGETIEEEDSTIPSDAIPLAAKLTKLPNNWTNDDNTSLLHKTNVSRTQKPITDFLQSKFLQKSDRSGTLNLTSFDDEKLNLIREKMEKIKQQEMEAMNMNANAKKKESRRPDNAVKAKNYRSKENVPKTAAKPAKVVDKAFIVNGTVYKRPKLPRPKPWVTDRLYHHLWKKMEPKFDLATRIKSEKFVVQLSEVVAVTLRRKKYDSYKLELDALMKEMAKLGIIKTRNDFYDFCYDFLPYDFRVKATPILMPGNVRNIPYDPETLHTPILADDQRSG